MLLFSVQHKQPAEIVLEMENFVSRAHEDCLCYLHRAHNLPELSCGKQKDAPATPSEPKKEREKTPVMIPKLYHAYKTTDTVRINLKNHLFVVEEGSVIKTSHNATRGDEALSLKWLLIGIFIQSDGSISYLPH